ncbi:zinc carboxypeptidase [Nostoc sp. NIES-2111]|nr:zinc carboxypeptidase [Nostoc sp. NIES-2111]
MLSESSYDEVPLQKRGQIIHNYQCYGKSVLGYPLEVFLPLSKQISYLIMAGHHGDEPETTTVLSTVLRTVAPEHLNCAVVLAANPDGLSRGTRANARGVDLNRNFPTTDWSPHPILHSWLSKEPKTVELSPGVKPASEPETQALINLVSTLSPKVIISLHARLACIDDPRETELGHWLSNQTDLPLVNDIGYPTPGSFGTWAKEKNISLITFEFPDESIVSIRRRLSPVLYSLLNGVAK